MEPSSLKLPSARFTPKLEKKSTSTVKKVLIFSYISGNGNTKKLLTFQEVTFRAQKNQKKSTLKKFLIFQKTELSRLKLKKHLIFQKGTCKSPKTNKKSALKKFLASCEVFVILSS